MAVWLRVIRFALALLVNKKNIFLNTLSQNQAAEKHSYYCRKNIAL
jgi:hypothetical protein